MIEKLFVENNWRVRTVSGTLTHIGPDATKPRIYDPNLRDEMPIKRVKGLRFTVGEQDTQKEATTNLPYYAFKDVAAALATGVTGTFILLEDMALLGNSKGVHVITAIATDDGVISDWDLIKKNMKSFYGYADLVQHRSAPSFLAIGVTGFLCSLTFELFGERFLDHYDFNTELSRLAYFVIFFSVGHYLQSLFFSREGPILGVFSDENQAKLSAALRP